jgi:Spy/CpxP family protein refolding chaperone
MRALTALPFLVTLSFVSPAFAEAPANTIMKVTPPGEKQTDAAALCAHKYRTQASQLAQLGAMLKLTDAQRPVFAAWRKARLDMFQEAPCPEPSLGFDVPAPKRVENQITILSATLDGLRKELPATEALYNALTPEQQAVFDAPIRVGTVPPPVNDKPQPAH